MFEHWCAAKHMRNWKGFPSYVHNNRHRDMKVQSVDIKRSGSVAPQRKCLMWSHVIGKGETKWIGIGTLFGIMMMSYMHNKKCAYWLTALCLGNISLSHLHCDIINLASSLQNMMSSFSALSNYMIQGNLRSLQFSQKSHPSEWFPENRSGFQDVAVFRADQLVFST